MKTAPAYSDAEQRNHGLWAKTAPAAPPTRPLAGMARADVAIVGAGYTGLSAALHLAEAGARVVVLEASTVGHGGSGRNAGLVNAGLWLPPRAVAAAMGVEAADRLLSALGAAPALVWELVARHGIACEAVHAGTLHCAGDAAGLEDLAGREAEWRARGAPVRLLDAAETSRRTGTGLYAGALLDERAGTIQPLAYVRGLARAAITAGARVHTGSAVREVAHGHGGWRLETAQGALTAPALIVATNAYGHGPWPELRAQMAGLPFFSLATAPLPPEMTRDILPGGEGCWDTRKILTAFRRDAAGRLVIGSVGALSGTADGVHRGWAQRMLARLYPHLAGQAFEVGWHGMIGITDDAIPRLHRLGPSAYAFSGCNGRGIAPGTAVGRALAELLAGRTGEDALPLPIVAPRPIARRRLREALHFAGSALWHAVAARS